MKYEQKSFTVPASSVKAPVDCRHGWLDAKGKCVLCGNPSPVKPERRRFIATAQHSTAMLPDHDE